VRALKAHYPSLGLVICLPQVALQDYYAELQRRVDEYGIRENVLFLLKPLEEAHRLWQASDVYLRPTTTDGDAVAIREALSMRVPVVASDAAPRPPGVAVFPSRDLLRFVETTRHVLDQREEVMRDLSAAVIEDNFPSILASYERLLCTE
jgi:glycosyltransferase involved in cell wall biosynthesis